MSAREWWRHFVAALVDRPIIDDEEPAGHRCNAMVFWSGKSVDTDGEKAAEFLAALVHAHHEVYGLWPDPASAREALDALGVPRSPEPADRVLLGETETAP